ncbi:aminotransferase class V-fold PLP-dependent enzyme [Candidatus Latescibacterota bacterium]
MKSQFVQSVKSRLRHLSRRDFFKGTGLFALTSLSGCQKKPVTPAFSPRISIPTYESVGVNAYINCGGYSTMSGGSKIWPEVRMAMVEASKICPNIDELQEAIGKRIGELMGAEWACVTSGCAAAITAATCACIAGTNPEKMRMLPNFPGAKNEVMIASNHRNNYDSSISMTGAKIVEFTTKEEMDKKINDRTAMIYAFGSHFPDEEGITFKDWVSVGKKHGVPLFVDAAAERPDVPNIYINAGVDLVGYSGGKALRGPQGSGLLVGRKDLVKAAYLNTSPHHSFGRPMKYGKEDIMGLLAAVDLWVHADHADIEKQWRSSYDYITNKLSSIPTVKTEISDSNYKGRLHQSNVAVNMTIDWDEAVVKISKAEMNRQMREGTPHISRGTRISAYNWDPGDEVIVAQRIYDILSSAVKS